MQGSRWSAWLMDKIFKNSWKKTNISKELSQNRRFQLVQNGEANVLIETLPDVNTSPPFYFLFVWFQSILELMLNFYYSLLKLLMFLPHPTPYWTDLVAFWAYRRTLRSACCLSKSTSVFSHCTQTVEPTTGRCALPHWSGPFYI